MTSKQTIGLCDFLEAVGRAGAVAHWHDAERGQ